MVVDERLVAGRAQLAGHERRQAPVLPLVLNSSGGAPTLMPCASDVLERPAVGAVGVEADRQILHHRQRRAEARASWRSIW